MGTWTISGAQGATINNGSAYIPPNTSSVERTITIKYTDGDCSCVKYVTQSGSSTPPTPTECTSWGSWQWNTAYVGCEGGDTSATLFGTRTCITDPTQTQTTTTSVTFSRTSCNSGSSQTIYNSGGKKVIQNGGCYCGGPTPGGDCSCSGFGFSSSANWSSEGGTNTIGSGPTACTVTCSNGPDWVSCGRDDTSVVLTASQNTGSERSGSIDVYVDEEYCKNISLSQAGTGGSECTITDIDYGSVEWDDKNVTVTYKLNGASKTQTFTNAFGSDCLCYGGDDTEVTIGEGDCTKKVTIFRNGAPVGTANYGSQHFGSGGGSETFTVGHHSDAGLDWTYEVNADEGGEGHYSVSVAGDSITISVDPFSEWDRPGGVTSVGVSVEIFEVDECGETSLSIGEFSVSVSRGN